MILYSLPVNRAKEKSLLLKSNTSETMWLERVHYWHCLFSFLGKRNFNYTQHAISRVNNYENTSSIKLFFWLKKKEEEVYDEDSLISRVLSFKQI